MLASKFGRNSSFLNGTTVLNDEQIMDVAPSIFALEPHESRSLKYKYIPTCEVLNGLRKEVFFPFFVAQSKSRTLGKSEFTKHMIRLRRETEIATPETNEIILINSHDGTSSYQMIGGMFRFVCMNGMVTGDTIADIRLKHKGNVIDNVIDTAYTITDSFKIANESMENMKSLELKPNEAEIFAAAALALKYDEDKEPIKAKDLLKPQRWEDIREKSIWGNFNVIQENIMRGGQSGRDSTGRRATTRPVNSIDANIKLNKALWILGEEMAKLKTN